MKFYQFIFTLIILACSSGDDSENFNNNTDSLKTKNVVILIIDGPRISETWNNKINIPNRINLLQEGVFIDDFMNNGITLTISGHSSILNGFYENLNNEGYDIPTHPSIFQYYLKNSNQSQDKAWLISSKDKLASVGNCSDLEWKDKFLPRLDCGNNGFNSGYRDDITTIEKFKSIADNHKPHLIMINLKDVDYYGHINDWDNYIYSIKTTDQQIREIWQYIQSNNHYKDRTALIVTNDHGRHLDENGGFVTHGDSCLGCKHIEFFALGPDFKKNTIFPIVIMKP